MLDCNFRGEVDVQISPRVLSTHVHIRYLPHDLKRKQIKTVLIVRNPKDTAVSYYNHVRGMKVYNYRGEWKDWLQPYLDGKFEYGRYTDYLLEWERAIKSESIGFPLHIVYYEDLKQNFLHELDKLVTFL